MPPKHFPTTYTILDKLEGPTKVRSIYARMFWLPAKRGLWKTQMAVYGKYAGCQNIDARFLARIHNSITIDFQNEFSKTFALKYKVSSNFPC